MKVVSIAVLVDIEIDSPDYPVIKSSTLINSYSKAVTELSAEMLTLEAAQSSFAKISSKTLFDYIR